MVRSALVRGALVRGALTDFSNSEFGDQRLDGRFDQSVQLAMLDPTFGSCSNDHKLVVTKVKQMLRGICDTIFKAKVMKNFQSF